MAEPFEFEIKPKGIDSTVRELRQLETQLDGVGDSMDGAGASSSNMAQNITAGVVAAQAAYAAITKLATAVGAAADEFERQAGIMNRFTGDITEAARRTNGLISTLDLMTAQSAAAAAGLTLTADQFATVSVRASEFAARTGGDATEALNSLMGAIATGRAGQLLRYGVDLQGITSITDKQTAAIAGLTEGYGDAESAADTFGGRLQVLGTRLDDAKTAAIAVVAEYGAMERGFDNLAIAADALSGEVGDTTTQLGLMEQAALGNAIHFEMMTESLSFYASVLGAIRMSGDQEAMIESAREIQALIDGRDTRSAGRRMAEAQVEILGARAMPADGFGVLDDQASSRGFRMQADQDPATATRGRAQRPESELVGTGAELKAKELRLGEEQLALENQLLDNNVNKAATAGELAILERERLELMAQQTAEAIAQKEALNEAFEAEEERQNKLKGARRIQDGITTSFEGIAAITKQTIKLTEEGGLSAGKAFQMALDEWLKSLAIQEALKGAVALAEGVGNAVMNTGHSAAKFAEAAQHFAIAAVAGGASAAIPNASGGGGGSGGEATRPVDSNTGADSSGGGNIVINYNSPTAEPQLGRMQSRANRSASRVFE